MKRTKTILRINLAILVLVGALAGTLLIGGCTTTDHGDSDHSVHHGSSCH